MLRPAPRLPLGSLLALLALSGAAALILVTELLPVGLLTPMSSSLGVTEGRIGFLATAYAGAATVAAIPLTALTRGLPRRPLLVGLLAGFAAVHAVTALSSSYPLIFGARILVGLLGGIAWSMLAGYAARIVPAELRGRAIAIALAGITVALSVGLPAGTALAGLVGWRGAFGVLSASAVALVGWVWWQVPALPGEPRGERVGLLGVLRLPGVAGVLTVTAVLLLGHQTMYTYLAPFAQRAGLGQPGLVLLVFGLSAVAGIWATGAIVDRHLRAVTLVTVGLVVLAMLSMGLVGRQPAPLLVAVAVWGLAFGGVPTALQTALLRGSGSANANAAGSLQTTVYNCGVAAGSFLGGLVLDGAGPAALPWLGLPLTVVAFALAARAWTQPRTD
jgi:predicted MFS family arabinose efflux permease